MTVQNSRFPLSTVKSNSDTALRAPVAERSIGTVNFAGNMMWWFDARTVTSKDVLAAVESSNCSHIVLTPQQLTSVETFKHRVVWLESPEEIEDIPDGVSVLTNCELTRSAAVSNGHSAGMMIRVKDLEEEFPACVSLCERGDEFLVIDIEHATYIPYELLIAKAERSGTQVLRSVPIRNLNQVVSEVDQSLNALSTMEQGVGVLFNSHDVTAIQALTDGLKRRQNVQISLVEAEVVEVKHTGLGHRVCVDTTSLMSAEEGMIIGSTGWGGIFVCSETHHLPHMNLREFRVNAGGIHSYIWSPEGKALYLSELKAGSEVLCVNKDGSARVVTVGRAKVERRPLIQINLKVPLSNLPLHIRQQVIEQAAVNERVTPAGENIAGIDSEHLFINTFLQNDWHVRVMGADGVVRHTTLLRPGDRILAHLDAPGRHTGLRVTEHIVEK